MPTAPSYESLPEPAGESLPVRRALISVADKTAVADFAAGLARLGVEIVSTGGTESVLREAGIEVRPVEDLTGFPEILDGRVKTLHPHLHAGLLAVRDNPEHSATLDEREIEPIDLVCVNLYPFARTVGDGVAFCRSVYGTSPMGDVVDIEGGISAGLPDVLGPGAQSSSTKTVSSPAVGGRAGPDGRAWP